MSKLPDKFNLQNDFPETPYEEWRKTAEKDLKGVPFEKKLITKTYEGIDLQPIYTKEDLKNIEFLENKPGFDNFVRGTKLSGNTLNSWEIKQSINYPLAEDFNEALRYDLERGQNAIYISLDFAAKSGIDPDNARPGDVGKDGVSISNLNDFCNALLGVDLEEYPVYINAGFGGYHSMLLFSAYLKKNKIDFKKVKGGFEIDPLGFAVTYGELPVPEEKIFECVAGVTKWTAKNLPGFKTLNVNTLPYHNAGASSVQELAFALATGVEYINQLLEHGLKIDEIANKIIFTFGLGSFYFMEVAKLRAARLLWAKIIIELAGSEESRKMTIHTQSSFHNQTIYDPYVNMLRTTTETFSAIVGGADSITSNPFDEAFGMPDEFSRRIARNTQIVLKEESHLDSIIDPAGGSYYIEKLTEDVAKKSWELFVEIQNKGGMLKALKEGFPQSEIEKTDFERKKDYAKRKSILVGSNMYANMKEEKLENKKPELEKIHKARAEQVIKFRKANNSKDLLAKVKKIQKEKPEELIEVCIDAVLYGATIGDVSRTLKSGDEKPVIFNAVRIHRASEIFEELRNKALEYKEKKGFAPKIFLATMGPVKQHKARADFSRGFFEVGGFDVIYKKEYNTTDEAVSEAIKSGAEIVTICSTDETYPVLVPVLAKELKEKIKDVKIILAGYPKELVEQLRKDGVHDFIFLGADVYKILKSLLNF
ncbi:MAG: acyl-CoA mutase large subunit family protein [Ignavibacteriae bacterium]|nr:acyl-CoA mutase large subunit family protein [Ignavibacteriota bacterium]